MTSVAILGAGFSGLTLAYALNRRGISAEVFERASIPGGLLSTKQTEFGLVETAANGLLANQQVEELFEVLGVQFAKALPTRSKRYIYWNGAKRWPISSATTLKLVRSMIAARFGSNLKPKSGESVRQWATRFAGEDFEERLMAPALQGIYAGDTSRLSASLSVGKIFGVQDSNPRSPWDLRFLTSAPRGKQRGTVAPEGGMGQLIEALLRHLQERDVQFHFNCATVPELADFSRLVVCTNPLAAAEIINPYSLNLSQALRTCEISPVVSWTGFFEPSPQDLEGFGCLFPKEQGFHSLGALFNNYIFANRSTRGLRSETWILGGALNSNVLQASDVQIEQQILTDRDRLGFKGQKIANFISRWPQAIPHYTVEWEETLKTMDFADTKVLVHGNYLGQLGLAQLLARSFALADRIGA